MKNKETKQLKEVIIYFGYKEDNNILLKLNAVFNNNLKIISIKLPNNTDTIDIKKILNNFNFLINFEELKVMFHLDNFSAKYSNVKKIKLYDFKNLSIKITNQSKKDVEILLNQKHFKYFELNFFNNSNIAKRILNYINKNVKIIEHLNIERKVKENNINNKIDFYTLNLNNFDIKDSITVKNYFIIKGNLKNSKYTNINIQNSFIETSLLKNVKTVSTLHIENNLDRLKLKLNNIFIKKDLFFKNLFLEGNFKLSKNIEKLHFQKINISDNNIKNIIKKEYDFNTILSIIDCFIYKKNFINLIENIKIGKLQIIFNNRFYNLKQYCVFNKKINELELKGINFNTDIILKNINGVDITDCIFKTLKMYDNKEVKISNSKIYKLILYKNSKVFIENIYGKIEKFIAFKVNNLYINKIKKINKLYLNNLDDVRLNKTVILNNIFINKVSLLSMYLVGIKNYKNLFIYNVQDFFLWLSNCKNDINLNRIILENIKNLNINLVVKKDIGIITDMINNYILKNIKIFNNKVENLNIYFYHSCGNIEDIETNFNFFNFTEKIKNIILKNIKNKKRLISNLKKLYEDNLYFFIKTNTKLPKFMKINSKIKDKTKYKLLNI